MRVERFPGCLVAVTLVLLASCTPARDGSDGGLGSGGRDPSGGTSAMGGADGTGGAGSSGGVTGVGGSAGSGGTTGLGGTPGTGSVSPSGGMGGRGGVGGVSPSGGAGGGAGAGGVSPSGGTAGHGGTGGVSTSGGTGMGGRVGTGGTNVVGTGGTCAISASLTWSSSDSLMNPVKDSSHDLVGIGAPTVVSYNSKFNLYATVIDSAGSSNMQYFTFSAWTSAGSATATFMDNIAGFSGSHSSPQLFYLSAQKKWYLITQSTAPAYSTASDPGAPTTWTKPTNFFSSTPSIVTQHASSAGAAWSDFWIICDSTNCHMFFTNQNGYLFRSQTTIGNFPNSFGTPVVVMQSSTADSLYEGASVYKIKGTSKYLLLVEALGSSGRYLRAWTADALDGTWTALADSEASPFAGKSNVTFSETAWTKDIANGEAIRDGYDETMTLNPCNLQFVYQGKDPYTTATVLPWKLGLLTRTN